MGMSTLSKRQAMTVAIAAKHHDHDRQHRQGHADHRRASAQSTADDGGERPPAVEGVDDRAPIGHLDLQSSGVHAGIHHRIGSQQYEEADGECDPAGGETDDDETG